MNGPDTLRNALIRMKNGQGLRRVIRDDGLNGLHIANPNEVANTKFLSREEFDSEWELVKSGDEQSTEDISRTIFGSDKPPTAEVRMNKQEFTNQFTTEVTPMAEEPRLNDAFAQRSENTDREAMVREIMGEPVLDATFSGEPVAANEESLSTLEEDRGGDVEAAEAREEELSGAFETHEAPDPETVPTEVGTKEAGEASADEEASLEDSNAAGDEPVAGNEDPTPKKKRTRKASASK